MPSQPLRWGILSTARINDHVIPALRHCQSAELIAVASRNMERARAYAAQQETERSYGSYAELLADDQIDCVYISVPNSEHAALTTAALVAGKHVLCEKPLATSREEGRALFEQAQASGRLLMEAFMYRHHDKTRRLRELVERGELGQIQVIRSSFHFHAEDPATDIRYRPELAGGALRDVGCYCTSMACFLAGDAPVRVAGVGRLASSGVEDAFGGLLSFADGHLHVFDCGMQSDLEMGVTVLGTEGRAHVTTPWYPHVAPAEIEIWRGRERSVIPTSESDPYLLEVENFCAAVSGDLPQDVTADETLRNLGVLDDVAAAAALPNYKFHEPKVSLHQ